MPTASRMLRGLSGMVRLDSKSFAAAPVHSLAIIEYLRRGGWARGGWRQCARGRAWPAPHAPRAAAAKHALQTRM